MAAPVKSEDEHRQEECSHVLKFIDAATAKMLHEEGQRDYKYQCVKCNRILKNLNGVLLGNSF